MKCLLALLLLSGCTCTLPDIEHGEIHFVDKIEHPDNTWFVKVYGMTDRSTGDIYILNNLPPWIPLCCVLLEEICHSNEIIRTGWTDEESVKKLIKELK